MSFICDECDTECERFLAKSKFSNDLEDVWVCMNAECINYDKILYDGSDLEEYEDG